MFLKTITLHGFKSFADLTRLDLQPGVTTIVGPNGCGKSNITDAIRWVLGEQSAKALRGGKMQDVIFQGSEHRKSVPFCQVTLVFSECEKDLGTQYHEVEISRKVTLEGGSDYFLNGKLCRLKDIQSLFMDTGIGQVSYSFLMQGQIDQILSSNPLERRSIFEEAAGITRYKAQRKEALNKLNMVEQNLTRVTDIIDEVSKRMGTLKRQASKAVRYQRLKHRLTHLDIAWNAHSYHSLNSESSGIKQQFSNAEQKLNSTRETVERLNRELAQRKLVKADIFQTVEELRSRQFSLRSAKEQAINQEQLKSNRIEHHQERLEQIAAELELLHSNASRMGDEDSDIHEQMTTQHSAVSNAEAGYREWEEKLSALDASMRERSEALQEEKVELIAAEKRITHFRSLSTRLEVGLESYHSKHEELMESFHRYQSDLEELNQQSESIEARLIRKQEEQQNSAASLEQLTLALQESEAQLKQLQNEFAEIEKHHTQLTAESSILENLQRKLEGFGAGTKAILQGELEALVQPSEVDVFSKHIQVDADYQQFCETVLGSLLESMVYSNTNRIGTISSHLIESAKGRASFLVPELRNRCAHRTGAAAKGPLRPAAELIRTSRSELEAALADILSGSYYAPSLEQAIQFLKQHPDFDFEQIATPSGEMITRHGCVNIGKHDGKSGSFLQRQNELRKLKAQISSKEQDLREANERLDSLTQSIEDQRKEREECRDILQTVEREISNLKIEKSGLERNISSNTDRVGTYRKQLEALDLDRERQETELQEVRQQLEGSETELEQLKTRISRLEMEVSEMRSQKEAVFEGLSNAKVVLSEEKQKLGTYQQTIVENRRRKEDIERRVAQYEKEQENSRQSILQLQEQIASDRKQAEDYALEMEETSVQLSKEEQSFQEFDHAITALESQLHEHREAERTQNEELSRISLSLSEKDIYAKTLTEKIREEYDINLEAADWKLELWKANQRILSRVSIEDLEDESDVQDIAKQAVEDADPTEEDLSHAAEEVDWSALQEEIQQLRSKINSMGPVNTLAIDEYTDLKERYEFLKSQSDDLWNSKNKLVDAISEINKTSESMFRETFDKIRTNFKETYSRLTGGGESDLELQDAEDVLDSGIEIIARPPGTRLRNLTLLSGGQKTMTAVALLFAIYIVKPSPFCVLDELDAPLDDANIKRFVDMLRDFTRFSQFLIVSHNKQTIAAADSIFGVTMEEKGVSKLISMRFNSDRDLIETMIEPERN
ncbi:MAG: chromosome segregation protein SMC [Puniceicoccaceae bacterium]